MAFQREFRILSCFLLLLFVAIQEGYADQRSESEKSLGLSGIEVEMDGRQRKLRDPLAVLHPAFQREFRACASTQAPDGACAAEGQSLPDLHDCALFYRCEGATPAPVCYTCPAGTLFNPDINECDANYICTLDPACTTASEVFPDKDNCAGFLICPTATGPPEHVQCPPGQLFNVATLGCVDGAVNCNGRPVCLYEGQTLPSVYDCKEYYQCDAALVPQPKQCTGTDLFDADSNSCRAAPLANCAGALRTVSITSRDSSSEGFSKNIYKK